MQTTTDQTIEFIYCACGCGKTRPKYDIRGRERKYIHDHSPFTGRNHTEESNRKNSESRRGKYTGSRHHFWKGDKVSYWGLHIWINNHLPKPEFCEMCNKIPPREAACITGIYNRDFKNWKYLCTKCHKIHDNIIPRLILNRKKRNKK